MSPRASSPKPSARVSSHGSTRTPEASGGSLVVVTTSPPADFAAARVLMHLPEVSAFGIGGSALQAAGVDLLENAGDWTEDPMPSAHTHPAQALGSFARLFYAVHTRKPKAALLVGHTHRTLPLASWLKGRGVRVLLYGAPDPGTDGPRTIRRLRRSVDRLAVTLPFEEPLWRERGVDAIDVGHPSSERTRLERGVARHALHLTPFASTVAILPGSPSKEARRMLPALLAAYGPVQFDRASLDARVLLEPSLDEATRTWASNLSEDAGVPAVSFRSSSPVASILPAFDAALCTSGADALECALSGVIPVVVHPSDGLSEWAERFLMRSPFIALPNLLLQRTAFPEVPAREATAKRIGHELQRVLRDREALGRACKDLQALFRPDASPSREVAQLLVHWLDPGKTAEA